MLVQMSLETQLAAAAASSDQSSITFKVGHISPNVAIESVDDHLSVCRSGDLYSSVDKTRSGWCSSPCLVVSNVLGLWKEVGDNTLVELLLSDGSTLKQRFSCAVEGSVEESDEAGSFGSKDLLLGFSDIAENGDALVELFKSSHVVCSRF